MEPERRQNFHTRKLIDYQRRSRRNPDLTLPHEDTIQKLKRHETRSQRRNVEQFLSFASSSSAPLSEDEAWNLEDQVESHSKPSRIPLKNLNLQVPLGEYVDRELTEAESPRPLDALPSSPGASPG